MSAAASARTARLPKRSSQYSGIVSAPVARSFGATNAAATSQPSHAPGHAQTNDTPAR